MKNSIFIKNILKKNIIFFFKSKYGYFYFPYQIFLKIIFQFGTNFDMRGFSKFTNLISTIIYKYIIIKLYIINKYYF